MRWQQAPVAFDHCSMAITVHTYTHIVLTGTWRSSCCWKCCTYISDGMATPAFSTFTIPTHKTCIQSRHMLLCCTWVIVWCGLCLLECEQVRCLCEVDSKSNEQRRSKALHMQVFSLSVCATQDIYPIYMLPSTPCMPELRKAASFSDKFVCSPCACSYIHSFLRVHYVPACVWSYKHSIPAWISCVCCVLVPSLDLGVHTFTVCASVNGMLLLPRHWLLLLLLAGPPFVLSLCLVTSSTQHRCPGIYSVMGTKVAHLPFFCPFSCQCPFLYGHDEMKNVSFSICFRPTFFCFPQINKPKKLNAEKCPEQHRT